MDVGTVRQAMEATERRAAALRKLMEAAEELGPDGIAELLSVPYAANGHANGTDPANATNDVEKEDVPLGSENGGKPPRGRDAIRRIVRPRPGVWLLKDLREAQKRDGTFTSNKATEVAVTRLEALGECRRVGKGRYEFFATEEAGA
jgi:hypothetical protein